jgi:hypothetical protein
MNFSFFENCVFQWNINNDVRILEQDCKAARNGVVVTAEDSGVKVKINVMPSHRAFSSFEPRRGRMSRFVIGPK